MANITETRNIAQMLHPLERAVLPFISKNVSFSEIVKKSGLKDVEAMRAVQWLENKKIVSVETKSEKVVGLDVNGVDYKKNGLPEKRFLKSLKDGKEYSVDDLKKKSGVDDSEINICIGTLKGKAAVDIKKKDVLILSITKNGKKLLESESLEEKFLKKEFPLNLGNLSPEEKFAFENLNKRKRILKMDIIKEKIISITSFGEKVAKEKVSSDMIEALTPEMIKSGKWKKKDFRRYDIKINVPVIGRVKRHFVSQAINYVKKVWLEMGFEEMEGNLLQTSFWDLDSLFVPQDHPARAMQDTFYLKDPNLKKESILLGKLPSKIKENVKKVHESGANTGSKGWGVKWDEKIAKEIILRTHTTVLSAQTISRLKMSDLPAKFFSVNKVFRNEALDPSHLFEFYQVEGIVVDENANFRHLLGYLKEFYKKMGYKDVRIRPAYFPYTEPSAEVDVLHPTLNKWIELGGAGIFRPEVVKPLLGKAVPVLAWGNGLERILAAYFGIKDIRKIYGNDLKMLKEIKEWML